MDESVDLWNSLRDSARDLNRRGNDSCGNPIAKLVYIGDVSNGEEQVSLWDLPDAK